ncbi:hypothetical protein C6P46_001964 [Rhodotorula mucilaginosa]|uniref:Zn(2)-C6 fungal-type domain-containing protein n=1 Tax=Rhodotorula mucilaginosa TaxID=5537 RepID=A0A9P7B204_RHOMI|nr:hypothetical protein C6P46_001964 [Rhodotorula mucilaginosa]
MPAERNYAGSSSGNAPKRIAKACEACRVRRTKCDGGNPCSKCTEAGGIECMYRARARPSRQLRIHRPLAPAGPASTPGSVDSDEVEAPRPRGMRAVEIDLERQCEAVTGSPISLVLPDLGTHPLLSLETPLPPPPDPNGDLTDSLCTTFTRDILPFFDFLSPARLNQLVRRHRELPASLTDDQLAFLYAIYAMGYLRQVTYATSADSERVPVAGEALLPMDPSVQRLDVTYFRHAIELVRLPSTVTALQALIILQLYCMAAASLTTTRQVVGKLCYCVQELGLLHPATAAAYPAESGTAALGFYVIFTDVSWAGLTGESPFLPEFDPELFVNAAGNGGIVAPAMGELILLEAEVLAAARNTPSRLCDPTYVLSLEARLHSFLQRFGSQTNDCSTMTAYFATKHYHFLRLLIRAPSAADPVLGISSLAILARSATLLLQHYERIFLTTHYVNCAWTVFARIVGAGHVVLQAVWRGEMIRLEAADLMGKVLWFLSKLETRWTETAAVARKNFLTLMDALIPFAALPPSLLAQSTSPTSSIGPADRPRGFAPSVSAASTNPEQALEQAPPPAPVEPVSDWPLDNGLFDDTWMLGLGAPPTDRGPAGDGADLEWWRALPTL